MGKSFRTARLSILFELFTTVTRSIAWRAWLMAVSAVGPPAGVAATLSAGLGRPHFDFDARSQGREPPPLVEVHGPRGRNSVQTSTPLVPRAALRAPGLRSWPVLGHVKVLGVRRRRFSAEVA